MLEASLLAAAVLWAGWFWLLYRFHVAVDRIDPEVSKEIGEPSLFWTAFNGHVRLVKLMRPLDLPDPRYAPLETQARVLRAWAIFLVATIAWLAWLSWRI